MGPSILLMTVKLPQQSFFKETHTKEKWILKKKSSVGFRQEPKDKDWICMCFLHPPKKNMQAVRIPRQELLSQTPLHTDKSARGTNLSRRTYMDPTP